MDILLDLAKSGGLEPKKVAATHGGEYSSACPNCGGKDRFRIWPSKKGKNCIGGYWCRGCDNAGDTIQFCRDFLGLDWKEAIAKANASVNYSEPLFEKSVSRRIEPPPLKWQEQARGFVDWASKNIETNPDVLCWLEQRGIPHEAVKEYRIGYCKNKNSQYGEFRRPFSEFGLPNKHNPDGSAKSLWIPKGIIMPTIEPSGAVVRLKIRRDGWSSTDKIAKYIALSGSMQGMNLFGDRKLPVMVVVESELDAYALLHSIGDLAFVVAVGSNTKHPDNVTNFLAESKPCLLICHDNDEGGAKMLEKWRGLYPHARACPVSKGKDIGEAVQHGVGLRGWFKALIS